MRATYLPIGGIIRKGFILYSMPKELEGPDDMAVFIRWMESPVGYNIVYEPTLISESIILQDR